MASSPTLVIGTRGSPLALAQAHETQDRLIAAHGWTRGAPAPVDHQDHGRRHPGPAALGSRRQGALHQGARHRAPGRLHRSRRPFRQGPADGPAGGHRDRRLPAARGRARRLHQPSLQEPRRSAARRGRRLRLAAASGAGAPPAARSPGHAPARQRADAARQARTRRGRCDAARHGGPAPPRAHRSRDHDSRNGRFSSRRGAGGHRHRDPRRGRAGA